MKRSDEKRWFKTILDIIREHRACALASVNVEHLLSCWQIGGVLSAKIKQDGWGRPTIDRLVDFIHVNAPDERGYGRSNLYSMVGVYEAFSSEDFAALVSKYGRLIVQPSAGQIIDRRIAAPSVVKLPGGVEIVQIPSGQFRPMLKAREFRPSDMGQLEFYLEALDRDVRRQNENPSIGILLCKNADRSVVEYAMSRTMSPAMVAEYKRMMIPKEVLQETFETYLALPSPRKNVARPIKPAIGRS